MHNFFWKKCIFFSGFIYVFEIVGVSLIGEKEHTLIRAEHSSIFIHLYSTKKKEIQPVKKAKQKIIIIKKRLPPFVCACVWIWQENKEGRVHCGSEFAVLGLWRVFPFSSMATPFPIPVTAAQVLLLPLFLFFFFSLIRISSYQKLESRVLSVFFCSFRLERTS